MKTHELFTATMFILWGEGDHSDQPKEAHAVASFIKNHRVNHENAFEVIRLIWPDAKMAPRLDRDNGGVHRTDDPSEIWYDVQFKDGSQAMVMAKRGIGDSVEPL